MIYWLLRNHPWTIWLAITLAGALLFLRWLTDPMSPPASNSLLTTGALSWFVAKLWHRVAWGRFAPAPMAATISLFCLAWLLIAMAFPALGGGLSGATKAYYYSIMKLPG